MGPITIVFGLLLTALGAWSYFSATGDHVSLTAAIPAFVGLPLILCGVLALKDNFRKHAMHGAVLFGLLGCLGAAVQVVMLLTKPEVTGNLTFDGDGWINTKKLIVTGGMTVLCGVFTVLCVRSFIAARVAQRKKAQETAAS
jgi:hypothetical protein